MLNYFTTRWINLNHWIDVQIRSTEGQTRPSPDNTFWPVTQNPCGAFFIPMVKMFLGMYTFNQMWQVNANLHHILPNRPHLNNWTEIADLISSYTKELSVSTFCCNEWYRVNIQLHFGNYSRPVAYTCEEKSVKKGGECKIFLSVEKSIRGV